MKIQHPFPLCYSFFLFLLATTTLISPSLGDLGKCNPSDYKALMDIKKSLSFDELSYQLPYWIQNTDCCGWAGVDCDGETNRVTDLGINDGGVSGRISSSVGDLVYLKNLLFAINITGTIPQSIAKLKKLTNLDLSRTSQLGPIPNFLNQLTALNHLRLANNQFSGSIPPNLSDLKNLQSIYLDRNKLTGSIPESFGKFTGLSILYLSENKLTGPIPKSLGALELSFVDLSRNKLVGDASILFNPNHSSSPYIDLSRNRFEFNLTKVKFPKTLSGLDISHNRIFGGIPKEIKDLESLSVLNVEYNRLCGKIPTGGNMRRFNSSSFSHNKCLCGSPLKSCKTK